MEHAKHTRVNVISQVRAELAALYQARALRDERARFDAAAMRIVPTWASQLADNEMPAWWVSR